MGFIFDMFRKKKEKTLTKEEKFNRLWELWEIGDFHSPVASLMTYESEVNNGGHRQYFFNIANCGDLPSEIEAVLSLLPEPLRKNLTRGYTAFSEQDDISDDINDELFEECDDIFYKHEQLIIDMIQETANKEF